MAVSNETANPTAVAMLSTPLYPLRLDLSVKLFPEL